MKMILQAFLLGLAYCAPFGIVNVEALRRGLARGFGAALQVGMGSMVGTAFWALIALSGAAFIVQNATVRLLLGSVGILFLLYLSFQSLRSALRSETIDTTPPSSEGDFTAGVILSVSNPLAVAFWLGVGVSAVTAHNPNPTWSDYAGFFSGFIAGGFTWISGYSSLIGFGKRFVTPALFRWIDLACGLSLLYLGGVFALKLLHAA